MWWFGFGGWPETKWYGLKVILKPFAAWDFTMDYAVVNTCRSHTVGDFCFIADASLCRWNDSVYISVFESCDIIILTFCNTKSECLVTIGMNNCGCDF